MKRELWDVWKVHGGGSRPWHCQLIHSQRSYATKKEAQAMVNFVKDAHEKLKGNTYG